MNSTRPRAVHHAGAGQAGARPRLGRRAGDERGTSLIEVVIVAALSLVALAATLAPVVTTQRAQVRAAAWQDQLTLASAQEARMVHEIRQAFAVVSTTPNSIDFLISVAGTREQVFYECDVAQPTGTLRECVRLQAAVGAALPALASGAPVVTNVLNGTPADPVFGYAPNAFNPTYVSTHLEFPASGGSAYGLAHPIIIDDGAYLRNTAVAT